MSLSRIADLGPFGKHFGAVTDHSWPGVTGDWVAPTGGAGPILATTRSGESHVDYPPGLIERWVDGGRCRG
jgi:hypothetical protein